MRDRVCVLETDRIPLVLRANPSSQAVREFVEEHIRRYAAGEPGGWNNHLGSRFVPGQTPEHLLPQELEPAYRIYSATFYESEDAYRKGDEGETLDIDQHLTKHLSATA